MAVFAYKAMDRQRYPVKGTIVADSPRQARDMLRQRGLTVQETAPHHTTRPFLALRMPLGTGQRGKIATTIRELATLLSVGIPLLEALDTITKQHHGRFQTSLLLLRDRISAGASLAEAMAEQPEAFDALCINMVEVGENAGRLDEVLDQLAEFKERSLQFKDRVVTTLLYPALMLIVSIGVTIFLMTVVTPMLLANLIEAGRALPWPTRVLKAISDILVGHGWWLALCAAASAIGLVLAYRTQPGRHAAHHLLLNVPMVGTMARKQAIARVALVIATLMKSGIVFVKAAEIAARSSGNLVLQDALERVLRDVGAGRDISHAMEQSKVFPPLTVQIFAVGQQTGRLEEMLERLAADYDREVATWSTRLATVLEPLLIIVLAVIIGFIMFATVLPILEAGNVL